MKALEEENRRCREEAFWWCGWASKNGNSWKLLKSFWNLLFLSIFGEDDYVQKANKSSILRYLAAVWAWWIFWSAGQWGDGVNQDGSKGHKHLSNGHFLGVLSRKRIYGDQWSPKNMCIWDESQVMLKTNTIKHQAHSWCLSSKGFAKAHLKTCQNCGAQTRFNHMGVDQSLHTLNHN